MLNTFRTNNKHNNNCVTDIVKEHVMADMHVLKLGKENVIEKKIRLFIEDFDYQTRIYQLYTSLKLKLFHLFKQTKRIN